MAIIDSKGKIFGKINIIDLMVVLLIIAIVLVGINKFIGNESLPGSEDDEREEKNIEVTVIVRDILPQQAQLMQESKKVFFNNSADKVNVKKVEVRPSQITGFDSEGQAVLTKDPSLKTIFVTLAGQGHVDEETGQAYLQGKPVIVGLEAQLRGEYIVTGTMLQFEIKE